MAAIALTFPQPIVMRLANRILLVDDNAVFRRALRRTFEAAGWYVCGEAADGRDAVEKAEQLQPQVILLDLAMPGMSGLTAARLLKQILPEMRLILLTGHGDLIKSAEARSLGIDAVVSKSEPIPDLLAKAKGFILSHSALNQTQRKIRT
jgi:CheY-like chemotaxis protein